MKPRIPKNSGVIVSPIRSLRHLCLRGLSSSIITIEAGPPGLVRPQAVEGVEPGNRHAAEVGSQLLDETLVYLQA